ncbi:MAG: benzoate transporter [Pseudomonas sp.]|nr:benzoate transporter [Pseudomonas sp.]
MSIKDFSLSAVIAGFLAVFVGFAGPLAIVYQAANLAGLSSEMTSSWIWAISFGSGISGLILSYRLKMPIISAWSTPGAALLVVSLPVVGINQAVGAYLVSGLLVLALGLSGAFNSLIGRIPKGIIAAMLAGILFNFGIEAFASIHGNPVLVLGMILAFFIAKRLAPRYSVAVAMLVGLIYVVVTGESHMDSVSLTLAKPVFIMPEWSWYSVLSLGFPLALVTLTGQHVPGLGVLKTSGFNPSANPIVSMNGLISLIFAPFGAHAINPSVVAASICTGSESNEDPSKRYVAGIAAGIIYIVVGLFGGALAQLLGAWPKELIVALAGLALIGSITNGLIGLVTNDGHRDASVVTFLVAASGLSFLGLGAAFWSLVIGGVAYLVLHKSWAVKSVDGKVVG